MKPDILLSFPSRARWPYAPVHTVKPLTRRRRGTPAQAEITRREIARLKGEMRVAADLLDDAWVVIHAIEGENDAEEEALRALQERMERMALHARGGVK
jgi:hypothetical protein